VDRCDLTAIDSRQQIDYDIRQKKIKIAYVGSRLCGNSHVIMCIGIRLICADSTCGQVANTTGNTGMSCEKLPKTTRLGIRRCDMI